jgi:hypothetical protein
MVLFAMLLFGMMALAALVIDIGFARLAQRQMQSASDSAALEGLRFGNAEATEIVGFVFDDDLDVADDPRQFGAGTIVEFSSGSGDPSIGASQLLTIPEVRSYKPILQNGVANPGQFVVKLQRGGTLDDQADLFAKGPPVPYLFARGSLINRELVATGITVRASSFARYEPVVSVGGVVAGSPSPIGVAMSIDDWNDPDTNEFFAYDVSVIGGVRGASVIPNDALTGYIAIFDAIANNRVIGFGLAAINSGEVVKQPLVSGVQIVTQNASATFASPLPALGAEAESVFQQRTIHRDSLVQAAVLVRN